MKRGVFYNRKTGEVLTEKEFFSDDMYKFIRNLMNYESKIKYSHKVDRKEIEHYQIKQFMVLE